jgi:hypothetical protein
MSAAVHLDAAWSEAGLDSRAQCGDEVRSIPRNNARRPPMGSAREDAAATTAVPRKRCSKIVEWLRGDAAQAGREARRRDAPRAAASPERHGKSDDAYR